MTSYSSTQTHGFAQQTPRFTCRYAIRYKDISELKGYSIKCRDPRCSLECNANWSAKHGACLARHLLENLPEGTEVYKGHLTMPKDSPPERHQAVKDAFLLAIRRWAKRHGRRVELHAVIHITNPQNAHWDYHLWTDSPYHPLRDFFNAAWKRAGGHHSSIAEPGDLEASARYQAKPVRPDPRSREVLLPASQKATGLDAQWSTRGFWCGHSIDGIWGQIIAEWKSGPVVLTREEYDARRACPECRNCPKSPCPLHQNKRDITDTPEPPSEPYRDRRYIPGSDPDQDRYHFPRKLSTDPADGVGLVDYAQRWGVSPDYMKRILTSVPEVVRTEGQLVGGNHSWNAWYRRSEGLEVPREAGGPTPFDRPEGDPVYQREVRSAPSTTTTEVTT